ncbi:Hypothetical protein NTJ_10034 [Nesidiocoris tenuis]|uniref:RPA-interacting protein C-terminal domain-containing protein n=1 Tax=Nesidiocoris tenuis TaxID=355587 RepID=A0ABN7AYG7_9HEMI|nr:Hypothetical protein NTJ_10034 [Nesidiocoris tenuis]
MYHNGAVDVLISPAMDSKIKKRCASYKRRNESPNFKDVLRERCQSRIRARRRALLDEFRHGSNQENIRDALASIVREEMRLLREGGPDLLDVEETYEDYADDNEDERILAEYYSVLEEEEAELFEELQNEVICPLCERSSLTEENGRPVCRKCETVFPPATLARLRESLELNINRHNFSCSDRLQFAVISEKIASGLYQVCETCGLFELIM